MKKICAIFPFLLIAASFSQIHAQNKSGSMTMPMDSAGSKAIKAICIVYPTQGNTASGVITFEQIQGGVKVVADIRD